MRVASDRPAGNGGYFHGGQLHFGDKASRMPYNPPDNAPAPRPGLDADLWWQTARRVWNEDAMQAWADKLGLPVRAMDMLGACQVSGMLAFPMRDGSGDVCGIRTRLPDGRKLAVRGSRAGIFRPIIPLKFRQVLVCEGPTDATAAEALDFDAIGRPSCQGCEQYVVEACSGRPATICADSDGPGLAGAEHLASTMRAVGLRVRVVIPGGGHKDLRDWYRAGATRQEVDAVWSQAKWR